MNWKQIFNLRGRRALLGYALGAITIIGTLCLNRAEPLPLVLPFGLAVGLVFPIAGALKLPEEGKLSRIAEVCWYLLAFFSMFFGAQTSQYHALVTMGPRIILLNMACAALIFFPLLLLTARPRISLCLTWALLLVFVVVDYAVYMFRGTELTPMDLLSAGTGLSVAGNYKFPVHSYFFVSMCLWALILFSFFCLPRRPVKPLRTRALAAAASAALACFWFPACYNMKLQSFADVDIIHNGLFGSFCCKLVDVFKDHTPEGYSLERVAALEERYRDGEAAASEPSGEAPDVIVIMNESFVDLSVMGSEPNTENELIPFFKSLRENAIRGYALTSASGGGTIQSEYAFLSSNALQNQPQRQAVYTIYFHGPAHSLVSEMERQGYTTYATHPYYANGYSRSTAYPQLGFDHISFLDDYPQQDLVREYVSDREMYDQVIQRYESKAPGERFFLFGVTMQNHGGFDYVGPDAPIEKLEGYSQPYPAAEQYLGLLQESDRALEKLVDYFEGVDSPVVLLFFGDHIPRIETAFYRELHGKSFDSLDEMEQGYQVPFVLWANFDIDERETGLIGLNYLSNYLYDAAGLELPPYNRFLRDMAEVIPAMNALGYYSRSAGKFLPFDQAEGEEAMWLNDYDILQYNSLFDAEHRSELFFPLPEVRGGE